MGQIGEGVSAGKRAFQEKKGPVFIEKSPGFPPKT
jgi:hypothetical protein